MTDSTRSGSLSSSAIVETEDIGEHSTIAAFSVVRRDVKIGRHVIIHPQVVIDSGVTIGDAVEIFPGSYIGKEPKDPGALARRPVFERRIAIGANTSIGPNAIIYYDVDIGEHTLIGDGASIREQCRIGSRCVIGRHVTVNYAVRVGDHTKIMDHSWLAGNMTIGRSVFVSGGVLTTNDDALGMKGFQPDKIKGPTLEDGAMIGAGAILLPNIVIGRGAIVGAGSVVTKDVPPATVVMGVPARFIRPIEEDK